MGAAVENIFNIITYSFIGWIIENTYCYCTEARFQNDGFLYGPYKPMYGIAMALLIVFEEIFDHKILIIVLCLAIPTMVEYLSGFILKGFFDKVYWDYSGMKFNLNGYICLKFSIYWMILSFIGIYLVHPLIKLIFLSYIRFFFCFNSIYCIMVCFRFVFYCNHGRQEKFTQYNFFKNENIISNSLTH